MSPERLKAKWMQLHYEGNNRRMQVSADLGVFCFDFFTDRGETTSTLHKVEAIIIGFGASFLCAFLPQVFTLFLLPYDLARLAINKAQIGQVEKQLVKFEPQLED